MKPAFDAGSVTSCGIAAAGKSRVMANVASARREVCMRDPPDASTRRGGSCVPLCTPPLVTRWRPWWSMPPGKEVARRPQDVAGDGDWRGREIRARPDHPPSADAGSQQDRGDLDGDGEDRRGIGALEAHAHAELQ